MILAIASGKGGTGKTTVSLNLARAFESNVSLLDCDVEEPNAHLFLPGKMTNEEIITMPIPQVEEALCDGCGECGRFCEYHAIVSFGTTPLIFPELCHGCGGCMRVCPTQAISEVGKRIGTVSVLNSGNIRLVQGRLDVGVATAPPLIRGVKSHLLKGEPAILDAPPGTSCPVIAAIQDTDLVVLVTEPTPFGLNDLKLAVDMVRVVGIPFGVIVNRMGVGDNRVHRFCEEEHIPILMEIPDDRRVAEVYSRGKLVVEEIPEYRRIFEDLWRKIRSLMQGKEHE
ncbi:MAG: ATP-binding protein [Syntrophaceae bacterium]|nr:ATP-binding protein [Syntrophaceae bacterium]